jgi:DNA polymerase-3 subunit delta'
MALRDDGVQARDWSELPGLVVKGRPGTLPAWPVPRAIDALQKLCHDALLRAAGMPPRYFATVPAGEPIALHAWAQALQRAARHAEHPLNAALLVESLVLQGRQAFRPERPAAAVGYTRSHE